MWPQQKNYLRTALCQLTVQRAHKQDHLAIISSQSQIHSKANVYREKWATVGEEENRTGGERGQERGMEERGGGGGGGYWSQGGVMVSQWREIVENIRNFHRGIPCN